MRDAATVLDVVRDRGRRGLPLERIYRLLFNPQLYLLAYGRIYANHGAMAPGADGGTADGMSLAGIGRIIGALRHERYRFRPVKRAWIPKKNGKKRPLGLPSWSDKIVGEVIRLLLEAYYEPRFSGYSHGFRPGRGCHTALTDVAMTWTGTTWFIESDIADCFGSLDHDVMLSALAENINDNRFLRLIKQMLKAGYLEDWEWNATLSGVPQGGVVSPVLSNIYLDRMDRFAGTVLMPEYTRGRVRARNPGYRRAESAIRRARRHGDRAAVRQLLRQLRGMPSMDPRDPGYRRLRYIRYADDALFGFTGPKAEAEEIKARLAAFLRDDLKLELSEEKTLITHARTQAARFLGYEITTGHDDRRVTGGIRRLNGTVQLRVPKTVITAKCAPYLQRGKPASRPALKDRDDHAIISRYGAEYRGIVQYYLLAGDVWRLDRLEWVMKTSMLKTLAHRHRSTVTKMARKHKAVTGTPSGPRRCFEARVERDGRKPLVARFGGIPLRQQKKAVIDDRLQGPSRPRRKELITRLLAGQCEWCEQPGRVEAHQVRKLADLTRTGQPQPAWAQLMARKRRKTLIVCAPCHAIIHAGKPAISCTKSLESRMPGNGHVRFGPGAAGKGPV
ncbi:MAG TPA: reverse transcriptase domain-containing protein [Trebonia sp.]|nr:reverse transcriptase domain-containing protein [Trebonia sp.]